MKKNRQSILLFVFLICLGLVWPAGYELAAQSRKSSAKKSSRAKKRGSSRRARSGRRSAAPSTPRPAFDKIMSENRALLSESSDAELAASQIEESKLRANVKYLADDLLEGRGPGSRGGMLAAKYIAAQFEALGLEPAATDRGYFQQVQMIGSRPDPSTRFMIKSGAGDAEFKFGDDFVYGTDLEQTEIPINSDIIFVGYGVNSNDNN